MSDFGEALARYFGINITGVDNPTPNIETAYVSSTCLSDMTYNRLSKSLTVTFRDSGSTYVYFNCPEEDYESVATAVSVGAEYNDIIKGSYPFIRLG